MNGGAVRFVPHRKADRAKAVPRRPVAATSHETADSTERMPQGDTRRHDVSHLPQWNFVPAAEDNSREGSADQPSVKNEPGAHVKNGKNRLTCEFPVPIGNYIQSPRAQNRANYEPGGKIEYLVTLHASAGRPAARCREAD